MQRREPLTMLEVTAEAWEWRKEIERRIEATRIALARLEAMRERLDDTFMGEQIGFQMDGHND